MKRQTNEYAFVGVENVGVVTELVRSFHVRTYRYTQHDASIICQRPMKMARQETRTAPATGYTLLQISPEGGGWLMKGEMNEIDQLGVLSCRQIKTEFMGFVICWTL